MTTQIFENSYAKLPAHFFTRQSAEAARAPDVIATNAALADFLNFPDGYLESAAGRDMISGTAFDPSAKPLAQVYAGHQFGGFSPQLGDGRALLIGEVMAKDDMRYDVQLKGSGQTPYSRSGDGLAALGPVIREYVMSEAMHALGVPTTRALAAIRTGSPVYREGAEQGAMLTRVALSHIRIGTFQFFAARNDTDAIAELADYAMDRHYPDAKSTDTPIRSFFECVCLAQAELIAHWMALGFIHGVMNTDNMAISGQTIDYGPCAFMDHFHAMKVFSSIDTGGRYAWARQPQIGHWNLLRFAETLIPIWDSGEEHAVAEIEDSIALYSECVNARMALRFADKLGLPAYADIDTDSFIQNTLGMMQAEGLDFTRFFASLREDGDHLRDWVGTEATDAWLADWQKRVSKEDREASQTARAQNSPIYIPRNHQVANAIANAEAGADQVFHDLLAVLQNPYERQDGKEHYEAAPKPDEEVTQTFCGT
ncbi:MAG: YdiU family protein [Pseudomonadota bacterium]